VLTERSDIVMIYGLNIFCRTATIEVRVNLTFIGSCIANIFADYNQQDATFHNLFISVRRSTCFRRFFRPSSGAVRYWSD